MSCKPRTCVRACAALCRHRCFLSLNMQIFDVLACHRRCVRSLGSLRALNNWKLLQKREVTFSDDVLASVHALSRKRKRQLGGEKIAIVVVGTENEGIQLCLASRVVLLVCAPFSNSSYNTTAKTHSFCRRRVATNRPIVATPQVAH